MLYLLGAVIAILLFFLFSGQVNYFLNSNYVIPTIIIIISIILIKFIIVNPIINALHNNKRKNKKVKRW
ncbi:hypothetical protein ACP50_05200 [Clostridium botulinum]|nr:hypothetical protein ACP50_05200 [Clostridium botulinum]